MKSKFFVRCCFLSFCVAFTILANQILIYRIVSAKLLNNYAFLIISLTMLGFAISGVILAFRPKAFRQLSKNIRTYALLFAWSLVGCAFLFYKLPLMEQIPFREKFLPDFFRYTSLSVLFVIPFTFGGLIISLLLAHQRLPTRKIYCFDLLGSALGAVLVIFLIAYAGAERGVLLVSAVFLGSVFITLPTRSVIYRVFLTVTMVIFLFLCIFANNVFTMVYPKDSMLGRNGPEYVQWDPVTRIEVSAMSVTGDEFYLCLSGTNENFYKTIRKALTQNNYAFTYAVDYDGQIDSLRGIDETIYSAAYFASSVKSPKVLVIGVGGGIDLLTALYFNTSHVTGIEINAATLNILKNVYKDYFSSWVNLPNVSLIHDEGRHYLSQSDEAYDVIQLSGVDSYAGTMASANIFSENYLYTTEAIKLYYSKLTDRGILSIGRLEFPGLPREMLRMLTTAVAALRELGIEHPGRHVMTVTYGYRYTALLIKKTPFTKEEETRLFEWARDNPIYKLDLSSAPTLQVDGPYQGYLNLDSAKEEAIAVANYPVNIQPVRDDKPFFFRYTFWSHLFPKTAVDYLVIPLLEYSVISLLLLLGSIALAFVYFPIRYFTRNHTTPKDLPQYGLIFMSIGLGYLFIEIAFMQKFSIFLGHPNYSICIVLSGLLLFTGLGSLCSAKISAALKGMRYVTYALSAILLLEFILIFPRLMDFVSYPIAIKALAVFMIIMPVGLLLGVYMPQALDQLKITSPQLAPWGWGINGIFSVISPILAIAISMTWGISLLFLSAIPLYLLAGYSYPPRPPGIGGHKP